MKIGSTVGSIFNFATNPSSNLVPRASYLFDIGIAVFYRYPDIKKVRCPGNEVVLPAVNSKEKNGETKSFKKER